MGSSIVCYNTFDATFGYLKYTIELTAISAAAGGITGFIAGYAFKCKMQNAIKQSSKVNPTNEIKTSVIEEKPVGTNPIEEKPVGTNPIEEKPVGTNLIEEKPLSPTINEGSTKITLKVLNDPKLFREQCSGGKIDYTIEVSEVNKKPLELAIKNSEPIKNGNSVYYAVVENGFDYKCHYVVHVWTINENNIISSQFLEIDL